MPTFRYKVKDRMGRTFEGLAEDEDFRAAVARLQEKGYYVLDIREARGFPGGREWAPIRLLNDQVLNMLFAGVQVHEQAFFFRQLATMVNSGMTLAHAMNLLQKQGVSRRLRRIAAETLPSIQEGGRLSDAFARYPWVFSEMQINLLRAGEAGGTLDTALQRIADYLDREVAARRRLRLATLYPKILVLAVILIPPVPLLVLVGGGAYLRSVLGTLMRIGIPLTALWVVYRLLCQIRGFRYAVDVVKLSVPKIGRLVRMLAISKFYRVLSSMCAAGIPLSQGVGYAANAMGNSFLAARLRQAVPAVANGQRLSDSLETTEVLQPMELSMLKTGEQAGNIDGMLEKAAEYMENEAELLITQATLVLGVLLFLCIAGHIASFVISSYQGLFGQYQNMMNQ